MPNFGKIARLPHEIREQLNLRILDNEPPEDTLNWLNGLPELQAIVAQHFKGEPVSGSNLSEYKHHGDYPRWLSRRDALALAQSLSDPQEPQGQLLARLTPDRLTQTLVLEYAAAIERLHENPDSQAVAARIRQIGADLSRMLRDNLRQKRLDLEQQRLAFQQAQAEQRTEAGHVKWTERPEVRSWLYAGLAPDTMAYVERDRKNRRPPFTSTPGHDKQNS